MDFDPWPFLLISCLHQAIYKHPCWVSSSQIQECLVGGFNLPLWKIWFVSWDHDIPNIIGDLPIKNGGSFPSNIPNQTYGNIKFMFQTTNQMLLFLQRIIGYWISGCLSQRIPDTAYWWIEKPLKHLGHWNHRPKFRESIKNKWNNWSRKSERVWYLHISFYSHLFLGETSPSEDFLLWISSIFLLKPPFLGRWNQDFPGINVMSPETATSTNVFMVCLSAQFFTG